jgi:acyl carrier protein
LYEKYSFQSDQIQIDTDFEKELGTDSREMLELINDFEIIFGIEVSLDDIDNFIFSGKSIKIQDVINYIEEKIANRKK